MNKNRIRAPRIEIILILVCLSIFPSLKAEAVISAQQAILVDTNGDGFKGNIGDSISVSCISTATDATRPFVNLGLIGLSVSYVLSNTGVVGVYSNTLSIPEGNFVAANTWPVRFDDIGNFGLTPNIPQRIDTMRPGLTSLTVSGANGSGGRFQKGDKLKMDAVLTNMNTSGAVYADFTSSGLGYGIQQLTSVNGINWTLAGGTGLDLPNDYSASNNPITVYAISDYNNRNLNSGGWQKNIWVDTQIPIMKNVTATIQSGNQWAAVGDQIKVVAKIDNYIKLNSSVVCTASALLPVGLNMTDMGFDTNGTTRIYQTIVDLGAGVNPIRDAAFLFKVESTYYLGSLTTPIYSNAVKIDTDSPGINPQPSLTIFRGGIDVTNPNKTAIIGDEINIIGTLTTQYTLATNPLNITADLTNVGGQVDYPLSINDKSFSFTTGGSPYAILPGAIDGTGKTIKVTAKDQANNVVYSYTFPAIIVDNVAPVLSNVNMTRVSGSGEVKKGDQIIIQGDVTNLDTGSVWTQGLNEIGIPGSQALSLYSGTTYRAQVTVGNYVAPITAFIDASRQYTVYVKDNAGNQVSLITPGLWFDNEMPSVTLATFTRPAFLGTVGHARFRVGDSVEFKVDVASAGVNGNYPYDGDTVTINLTQLGGAAAQAMTYDGVSTFTYKVNSIPAGILEGDISFSATIKDNAGNTVNKTITVPIDNSPPVIHPMVVSFLNDKPKTGTINIGDQVQFSVQVTDSFLATSTIDLSYIGSSTNASLTWDGIANLVTSGFATGSSFQSSNYIFWGKVYDTSGNLSQPTSDPAMPVDCRPPSIISGPTMSFVTDRPPLLEANYNDVLRFSIRVSDNDSVAPVLDFKDIFDSCASTAAPVERVPMTGGPELYTYDWTVPASFSGMGSLTVRVYDGASNTITAFTNQYKFQSKIPVVNLAQCTLVGNPPDTIANIGNSVTLRIELGSGFSSNNNPPASIVADIRSIIASTPADDAVGFEDGDASTYWEPLPTSIGSGGVYTKAFTVGDAGRDLPSANFGYKVLYPGYPTIAVATGTMIPPSGGSFGIDSQAPRFLSYGANLITENGDNVSSSVANIGDIITVWARITDYPDSGGTGASVSVIISASDSVPLTFSPVTLTQVGTTDLWQATLPAVTSGTEYPWSTIMRGNDAGPGLDPLQMDFSAGDDAKNISTVNDVSTFTIDNAPVASFAFKNVWNCTDPALPGAEVPFLNVGNVATGTATDTFIAKLTVYDNPGVYKAWIDLSSIKGSSTQAINISSGTSLISIPYELPTGTVTLTTYTLPITIKDFSGNMTATYTQVSFDTVQPVMQNARYNGTSLILTFSELMKQTGAAITTLVNQTNIRIGRDRNQMSILDPLTTIALRTDDVVIVPPTNQTQITITIGTFTQSKIADWGDVPLYLAMGKNNGVTYDFVCTDEAGNLTVPVPVASPAVITLDPYALRPNLIGGYYDARSVASDTLFLLFDRAVATNTMSTGSLGLMSLVRNTSDHFILDFARGCDIASGASLPSSSYAAVKLSKEAQNWIAMKYKYNGTYVYVAIDEPNPGNPAFIRDIRGNKINPIPLGGAIPLTLTPVTVDNPVPSFVFTSASLSIQLNGNYLDITTTRPVRTYGSEGFDNSLPSAWPKELSAVYLDPTKIYICKTSNPSGTSISLNEASIIDSDGVTPLNPDYSSPTIRLRLSNNQLQTIIDWNTKNFYIVIDTGAFRDIWDNPIKRNVIVSPPGFAPQITLTKPAGLPRPRVVAFASDRKTPMKAYPAGGITFEVEYQLGTISTAITIPPDFTSSPTLGLRTQAAAPIHVASFTFVGWRTRDVLGTKRYVANFTGGGFTGNFAASAAYLIATTTKDIFGNLEDTSFQTGIASYIYQIADNDIGDPTNNNPGFKVASRALVLDQVSPTIATMSHPIIRVTPSGTPFTFKLNETVASLSGNIPGLQLLSNPAGTAGTSFLFSAFQGTDTVVFTNQRAIDGNTYPQGAYKFVLSNIYDLADNLITTPGNTTDTQILATGPVIAFNGIKMYTRPLTLASATPWLWENKPFAPRVNPGASASINVLYTAPPLGSQEIRIYDRGANISATPIATRALSVAGLNASCTWDGKRTDGTLVDVFAPTLYDLRIFDAFGNEGSQYLTFTYDNMPALVTGPWKPSIPFASDGKVHWNAAAGSLRIEIPNNQSGQNQYLAVYSNYLGENATYTYGMSADAGFHYIGFNGKKPAGSDFVGVSDATETKLILTMTDEAGNLASDGSGLLISTMTLVIDKAPPQVTTFKIFRAGTASETLRFNPNVGTVDVKITPNGADPTIIKNQAFVRFKNNSTNAEYYAGIDAIGGGLQGQLAWKGTDTRNVAIPEGSYLVDVVDWASNTSVDWNANAKIADFRIVTASFTLAAATEKNRNQIQLKFSQSVATSSYQDPTSYALSSDNGPAISVAGIPTIKAGFPDTVICSLTRSLQSGETITVTASSSFRSVDDDPIVVGAGANVQTLTPGPVDVTGPTISKVDVTGTNDFTVTFDNQVTSASAVLSSHYTLVNRIGAPVPLTIKTITYESSGLGVKMTTLDTLVDGVYYVLNASDVQDNYENKSSPALASYTFSGKDLTGPQFIISAFSNPANEYDVAILARALEPLTGLPTAVVTQSGGVVSNITLNQGPGNNYYMGSVLMDKNYSGDILIEVSGKDATGNTGQSSYRFSKAVVLASVRSEVKSPDGKLRALFLPGTLQSDSTISIMPIALEKVASGTTQTAGIRAKVVSGVNPTQFKGLKFQIAEGKAGEELSPTGNAYAINIPAGRMIAPMEISLSVPDPKVTTGYGLFYQGNDGSWRFITRAIRDGKFVYNSMKGGQFAALRDNITPRITTLTKVDPKTPFRDPRPQFDWIVSDGGSGINPESIKVILDNKETEGVYDPITGKVVFKPFDPMVGGEHEIALKVLDNTGNETATQKILFAVLPPLVIHEVTAFPSPAKSRMTLRVGTNRTITSDLIEVSIYDSAGHKVRSADAMAFTSRFDGFRLVQEMNWDLTNEDGNVVSNGVYFAKIVVRDPDDGEKKTKTMHKIAVLR